MPRAEASETEADASVEIPQPKPHRTLSITHIHPANGLARRILRLFAEVVEGEGKAPVREVRQCPRAETL